MPTSTRAFFAQIGLHLGVDTDLMLAAACGEPFVAPSGLLCRLHAEQHEATCRAYPEVLLPLAGAELGGADVERLLAIQEHALTEYGWRLGLADEGLLSLRPLFYPDGAEQVATQLDQAQALGRAILSAMLEEAPAAHSVEAQR
ncbi:Hpa3 family type III secretion system protein [Xanthomonas hyacinthi]|uniref:Hpa3 family type III secretion system protein n=1 Tax=Xanthomonas hyacinthi TaxID=56455 RepID=UPI0036147527